MNTKYRATRFQTNMVYSADWGYGKIEKREGNAITAIFSGKTREFNFNHYHNHGRITYVMSEQEACARYLLNRNAEYLVHFTPVDNIRSIFEEGIVPRGQQKHPGVWTDKFRIDGHTDCSCFSVSYPNYSMLYQKRRSMAAVDKNGMRKFAILLVDPSVLKEIDENNVAYYQTNAAGSGRKDNFSDHTGLQALRNMFSKSILDDGTTINRDDQFISNEFTTHPQAEILIRDIVPSEYIKKVVIVDDASRDFLPNNLPSGLSIESNADMFWPQDKWIDYEARRKSKSYGYQTGFYRSGYHAVC